MSPHHGPDRGLRSRVALLGATAALLLLGPLSAPALAHVTASTQEDPDPGTEVTLEISFDHGCAGEPTTELAVQLPDGIDPGTVEPLGEDGWSATLDDRTVTWSGGEPVPDHTPHTFRLALVLPDTPGETIHLPTIQRCGDDQQAWIQVPDDDQSWSELDEPAPALTLTDAPAPARDDADDAEEPSDPTPDTPAATPPADVEEGGESFLTDDGPSLTFPSAVLAVLVALGAIATVAVLLARRGAGDDPSA